MGTISQNTSIATTNLERIEVLSLTHFSDNRSSIKATARVKIGVMVIDGIKVILPALASRPFVSMPSRRQGDDWRPVVSILSPTLEQAVSDIVLAAWRMGGAL